MEQIDGSASSLSELDTTSDSNCPGTEGSASGESNGAFNFSPSPTLEDIRNLQSKFCIDRNWSKFHTPRNLLLALVGEVGELSELFQWRGEVEAGCPDWTVEEKTHLGEEMADVLIYLTRLADVCQIDLPAVVQRKIGLNNKKYPVEKSFGSSKKYTAYVAPMAVEANGRSRVGDELHKTNGGSSG